MAVIKSKLERLSKPGEKWALVCEGYHISNLGRWYSSKALMILKQVPNRFGYMRASVNEKNKKTKTWLTHLMVIRHFGDRNGNFIEGTSLRKLGLSVDHINRDKRNNSVSNLEIVTHSENCVRYQNSIVGELRGDLPY